MFSKPKLQFIIIICISFILALYFAGNAYAVEIVDGETISAGEIIDDDVFISGNMVVVDGTINGDLFATGNLISINGIVNGSLVLAGQNIKVNGQVTGSIYAASSGMTLGQSGSVGRNLFYAGFGLETKSGSIVNRDLLLAGYQGVLSGKVERDVLAAVGALHLNGEVGGDITAQVAAPGEGFGFQMPFMTPPGAPAMVASGLHVSDEALIGGTLKYTSEVSQQGAIKSDSIGDVVYQTPQPAEGTAKVEPRTRFELNIGRWLFARLRELATLLVLGGLTLWLIPTYLFRWVDRARSEPLPSAGWGFISIIVGYVGAFMIALSIVALAIFLGVITLGGLARSVLGAGFSTLGLFFTIFSLFVSYGSKLIIAYLAGRMVLEKVSPQNAGHKAWPLLLGVFIYVLIRSIPFVGWLVGVVVTLMGIGAIWLVLREGRITPSTTSA